MIIYNILKFPNYKLRLKSKLITSINKDIIHITKIMNNTMKYNHGLGISAPQINMNLSLIIIKNKKKNLIMINPKIIHFSKNKIISIEGCLSLPNKIVKIYRYKKITVVYKTLNNKFYKITVNNNLSICIQHEIDHLYGILCIDY